VAVVGKGIAGYSGDGGPAIDAALQITPLGQSASGIVLDGTGKLYVVDSWSNRIRRALDDQ